jgi:hypothetical protein
MPVDDKPVVLVSDNTVEIKPLVDEKKDIAACPTVCVDTGVQTDDSCDDPCLVHVVPWVDNHRLYVSTPVRRFVGAVVRMNTGKDERVCPLCGPGITNLCAG